MTKPEMIKKMAEKTGMTRKDSEAAFAAFVEVCKETLAAGEELNLIGFATIGLTETKPRTVINLHTKEPIFVPAHKRVTFTPGQELKAAARGKE